MAHQAPLVHGISQVRILESLPLPTLGDLDPGIETASLASPALAGGFFEASLVAQMAKSLPAMWETQVRSLGWEDLQEKEMVTHSSILAWKIP